MANIVVHTINGSKGTFYQDFVVTVDATGQKLTVSAGSYWQNNVVVSNNPSPLTFDIPQMPTDPTKFQDIFETFILITTSGVVMVKATEDTPGFIDRLAWFSLTPDFKEIQVEYITMVES